MNCSCRSLLTFGSDHIKKMSSFLIIIKKQMSAKQTIEKLKKELNNKI